jgi:sigma-B regulation protein RsbU (phosphoserine phosphatase)
MPERIYKSDELLTQLLDNIDDKIYFKDLNSRFILINKSSAKWHGIEHPEDAIGTSDSDRYQEEDALRMLADEQQIIKTGIPIIGMEERETWDTGEVKWVSTTKMPLRDAHGKIIGTFGISRDITEHKLNEIKLQKYTRRLTTVNKQMEEDLQMAANLQQAFLPQSYPLFMRAEGGHLIEFSHRYLASTQVSGDLCSIHKLNDTEVGMLVFDVMGHGVRAALITAMAHTMIEDLVQRNLSPGEFFSEMNRQLKTVFSSQDAFIFVTACYLVLNTETGILRGASAGHPAPFIIHKKTSETTLMHAVESVHGPALAVVKNFEYKTCKLQLKENDTVVMYTDGILEETNRNDEEFGTERAIEILGKQTDNAPDLACDKLVDAVKQFNEADHLNDDICLLAFRWNGPAR